MTLRRRPPGSPETARARVGLRTRPDHRDDSQLVAFDSGHRARLADAADAGQPSGSAGMVRRRCAPAGYLGPRDSGWVAWLLGGLAGNIRGGVMAAAGLFCLTLPFTLAVAGRVVGGLGKLVQQRV